MLKRMVSPMILALALALGGGAAWAQSAAAPGTAADGQMAASPAAPGTAAHQNVLTSERLTEMTVKGSAGEDIGQIKQLLIDPQSGQIQGVVVSVGGFLGIGAKDVALDWQQLQIGSDQISTGATREQLEQAQAWQDPDEQTAAGGQDQTRPAGTPGSPPPAGMTAPGTAGGAGSGTSGR